MDETARPAMHLPTIAKALLFALVCLFVSRLGVIFALYASGISLVWPLTGVALATYLLFGRRLWMGQWLGVLISNLISGMPLLVAVAVASGSTGMAVFGAYVIKRRAHVNLSFRSVRDVLLFVGIGVIACPIISAGIGATSFVTAGLMPSADYGIGLLTWWVGDAMGVLVVTPALLFWGKFPVRVLKSHKIGEVALLLVLAVAASWLVFSQSFAPTSFYPLAFMLFPFLVWGALRFDQRAVATLTLVISAIAVIQTTQQLDSYSRSAIWDSLLFLWAYIATTSVTAMLLAATFAERRDFEHTVGSLEERFSKAFHSAPVAMWIATLEEGSFVDVNEEFCNIMGYSREEAVGSPALELKIWEYPEARKQMLTTLRQLGKISQLQVRLRTRFGEMRDGLISLDTIELAGVPRLLGMFHDITARLQAEEALRHSESHYRQLFEGIDDTIFVHDLQANILDVNEATVRRLGYTRDELLQMKLTDIDAPSFASGFADRLKQQLRQGYLSQIEGKQITKDGREIFIDANTKLITYKGRPAVLAVNRDITERKLAEEKLRESEARYRAIIEDQAEMICRLTTDWELTFVNDAYCRYFDKSREELLGTRFKPTFYPGDDEYMVGRFHSLSAENPVNTSEFRLLMPPDGAVRWHQVTTRAILDNSGKISEYQLVGKDITDLKEMEKQRLATALEHEKVKILADFIAAASHDFRTPLSVINTSAYLLNRVTDPALRERHFRQIQDQTTHIEQLVEGLLTMSRLDRGDVFRFKKISLNSVIQQLEARRRPQIDQKQLLLTLDLASNLPPIDADESWMFRAIMQILDNAIHYTPNGGDITIRTCYEYERVIIAVIDSGVGITAEDMPHIFKRLYRGEGHRPVGGQGLGLSIASKIVEAHQGSIEVESQPGMGSIFRIILPVKHSGTTEEAVPSP